MKKILWVALLLFSVPTLAQNVQLHYDFGRYFVGYDQLRGSEYLLR